MAGFTHTIRVRYGECDMQGVVFNSHYLAYVDDAIEHFLDANLTDELRAGFDIMLKKATVEWVGPAKYRDHVTMAVSVTRWGNTSFDVAVEGTASGRPSFTATIVYVSVTPGTADPVVIPEPVRAALS